MALKNDILSLLEQNRTQVLSGSALAERFGVSRNAVWKAVNALKEEGHSIETVGKKGYRLTDDSDLLSEEGIRGFLRENIRDIRLFVSKEVGSTNDEAKLRCIDLPDEPAVFVSDSQLSGKGRFGRSFYSPAGTGLYLSCVIYPHEQISRAVIYTAMAAVAAARAVERVCGVRPGIKWINDLYINERKVAGILTEAETDFETGEVRRMIVGIGLNITTADFPDELKDKAASIGVRVRRNQLAAEIVSEFYDLAAEKPEGFMQEYRSGCFLTGREITFSDGREEYKGTVAGVGDGCELILDTADGRLTFAHGEILHF